MVQNMMKRYLISTAIFALTAAVIQCLPLILGENCIFLTIFSMVPIYLITYFTPRHGIYAVAIAFTAIIVFSMHEGLIFLLTNGCLGLASGFFHNKKSGRLLSILVMAAALFIGILLLVQVFSVSALIGHFNTVNRFLASNVLISAGAAVLTYFLLLGFNRIMISEVRT